jgi:PAS domain S-box-containing protein
VLPKTPTVVHVAAVRDSDALERSDYRVHHVPDAADAVNLLADEDADVVVHDGPPADDRRNTEDTTATADALDALEMIIEAARPAPVLARTPEPDGEYASAASACGADAYCTHGDDVVARLDDLLDRSNADERTPGESAADSTDEDAPADSRRWYRRLYEAASEPADDYTTTVERLLAVGCERLDLPYGFLTRFEDGVQHVGVAVGNHPDLQPGETAPLDESYCQYTADTDDGYLALADAETQLDDERPYERFGLGCYVGGVVSLDGEQYGSLCFAGDPARATEFDDADRTFVEFTVELCEHELVRHQYREELEHARAEYERVLERIDDAFFALDTDWRFTYVNNRAADILQHAPSELLGEYIWEVHAAEHGDRFRERYEHAMTEQEPVTFEAHFEPLDTWLEVSAYPATDGLSAFFRDITERKRRERQLSDLLDALRDLYGETDREAIAQRVVDATQDILGYEYVVARLHDPETDTLEPTATTETLDRDVPDRPTYDADEGGAGEAFQTGTVVTNETYRPEVHGPLTSARYYPIGTHGVLTVAARYDEHGISKSDHQLAEILTTNAAAALDLAARQRSLERYETVLENVQDMVFVLDDAGTFEYVTDPLARTVGWDRERIRGLHASELIDADAAVVNDLVQNTIDGDALTTLQFDLQTPDGTTPIRVDASVLPGADRDGIVGVVYDISDLTETRERLETENARFRRLFESLPDPVVENRFDDGTPFVERVNSAFEEVFGYDAEALVGENLNDYILPEEREDEARQLDDSIDSVRPDEATVVSREVVRETARGPRYFLFRGISYLDGDVHRGYGIYTDITLQRERERRLQVLNTILRHNLRTEMTLVAGYVDELAATTDEHELTERIRDAVDEVVGLSDKARELERALEETPELGAVDAVEHVRNGIADATKQTQERAVALDATPATAFADHRLETVVRNLVENAFEHGAGPVTVTVSERDETVEVRVSDEGDGVPDFERELVAGERDITQLEHGSGLGLWIATWLLDGFDGDLRFEDDASTVVAVVPRADAVDDLRLTETDEAVGVGED